MSVADFLVDQTDGPRVIRFSGDMTLACIRDLPDRLAAVDGKVAALDLSGINRIDTVGAWIVHRLATEHGAEIRGLGADGSHLIDQVAAADHKVVMKPRQLPPVLRVLDELGAAVMQSLVTLVGLLAFKDALHDWLDKVTWKELRSALLILAATAIALPLLPDRTIDPWDAINPRELWLLTIFVAGASFAGYVAVRVLGSDVGVLAGAAAPGAALDLELSQAQLAARLGTVREPVARAFSLLEKSGIIRRTRARIVICDPDRLAALARGEAPAASPPERDVT